jgi:hypothetical protein
MRSRCRRSSGLTFVHPFDDPDVIAGQGTIGMEILRQRQGRSTRSSSPIGGGGLISGVASYVKAVRPEIKRDRRADRPTRTRWRARSRPASASTLARRGPVLRTAPR